MHAPDAIKLMQDFLTEPVNKARLANKARKKEPHIVLDFSDIIKYNNDIGDYLAEDPEESLKAFAIACKSNEDGLPEDFVVRIKNFAKEIKSGTTTIKPEGRKLIKEILPKEMNDKFVTIEGIIKRKSRITGKVTSSIYECRSCGGKTTIFQTEEHDYREPKRCGCGRAGNFIEASRTIMNLFSMTIEEPSDLVTDMSELPQAKILCGYGLTNPEVERLCTPGARVEVTGIVKLIPLFKNGKKTPGLDYFIEANYIRQKDDILLNLKWNEEDIKQFRELASKEDCIEILRRTIFHDIHKCREETEAVVLQLFGGVSYHKKEGSDVRGNFHILLVGDPGTAKSSILKIAQKYALKSKYVAGSGISAAGLTACPVKDELLGGWSAEAGAIPLCNGGLCCVDELDKVDDEHKRSLHEPLEQQSCSIDKANIHITLPAKTSILAAANPKHGSYDEYTPLYEQIELDSTLINRFDLVYPIKDSDMTREDHSKIFKKRMETRNSGKKTEVKKEYDPVFIKKYIAYAKQIEPDTENVADWMESRYLDLQDARQRALQTSAGNKVIPINARHIEGFIRITEAVARARLHKIATQEDAELAVNKIIYSVKKLGIDPTSGQEVVQQMSIDNPQTILNTKKITSMSGLLNAMETIFRKNNGVILSFDELKTTLKETRGVDDDTSLMKAIDNLKHNGVVFQPRANKEEYKLVG